MDWSCDDWNERKIDVLYVGGYKSEINNRTFSEFEENIIQRMLTETELTTEQIIEEEIKKETPDINEGDLKEKIIQYKHLDWYVMTYMRTKVIRILVEAGINVTVYGAFWDQSECINNPHFKYGGSISPEECIEQMKDSKIVLNVMPWFKDGIHERVTNAMLAGAVSVTDDSCYMSEVFDRNKDYVCYSLLQLEQLPGIVQDVLKRDNMEMIRRSKEKARAYHKWTQRIIELEKQIIKEG